MTARACALALLLAAAPAVAEEIFELPPPPPNPCVVRAPLRDPALAQLDLGDEATIRGDTLAARGHYRAALTLDVCNAFAWAQLGATLLASDPALAATALDHATQLMPTSFRAWTDLGHAREALGDDQGAMEAYREALVARPAWAPAEAGLRRTLRPIQTVVAAP